MNRREYNGRIGTPGVATRRSAQPSWPIPHEGWADASRRNGSGQVEISKSQQEKLVAKLNAHPSKGACEVCDAGRWVIINRVYELRDYNEGNFVGGTPLIPLVV